MTSTVTPIEWEVDIEGRYVGSVMLFGPGYVPCYYDEAGQRHTLSPGRSTLDEAVQALEERMIQ
jgi:hypothetical protein